MAQAELHLHLEGSIEPGTLRSFDASITDSAIAEAYYFQDFAGFIQAFKWVVQWLRGSEDYALATRDLCHRLHMEGITYAEITFAAGVVLWRKQDLAATFTAIQEAAAASAVDVKWNLDTIRQFGPELAWQVAEFAAASRATSFGIGGDEVAGPAEWFAEVYKWAKQQGLHLTAHAGETAGPVSVWSALEIGAERIGHGFRAVEDPVLVRHLAEYQIPLEICLTSNVRTGAVGSLEQHPLRRLFDAGVPITLNTDDPAIFKTTLAREFELARAVFGFSEPELDGLRANSWRFRFQ